MVSLAYGQVVTVNKRRSTGDRNDYGDEVWNITSEDVPGCAISPGNTLGDNQGTTSALADVIVYMPIGTDIQLQDTIVLPTDGRTYWVNGVPQSWQSPFTGTNGVMEIRAVVTTGGPQAG